MLSLFANRIVLYPSNKVFYNICVAWGFLKLYQLVTTSNTEGFSTVKVL